MPVLEPEVAYDGVRTKLKRLGLAALVQEVRDILTGFRLEVEETRNANGGAAVREMVDAAFEAMGGWTKTVSGGVDWMKCRQVNGIRLCVGVEVQISSRSDLLVVDVIHLRDALEDGKIDIAVIVVPSNTLSVFLPDRTPSLSAAERHVAAARAEGLPILLIPFTHDGPGPALPKRRTNRGRLPKEVEEKPTTIVEDSE